MGYEKVLEKVFDEVEKKEEEQLYTTQLLVRLPSLLGQETEAQRFMKSKFKEIGLKVDTFKAKLEEIKEHPAYIKTPAAYESRPNVVGILEGSDQYPSLILNGHVDVVSPEPLDRWEFDPWGGEIKDGRLYGRGALDMKAGLIANLFAAKAIMDSGVKPKGTLTCQSVIEEEVGGSGGALACFLKGYKADGMIISEPSDLYVNISHNGIKYFRVRVAGKTAHAAFSQTGVNAIGKMNKIYDALIALDEKRAAGYRYPLVEKWGGRSCNLNVGTYSAGDWASNVAGMATMECRVGFVPGEKGKDVMKEVEETILNVAQKDPWLREYPPTIEWYGWDTEPWVQDENEPLIQSFLGSSGPVLGKSPDLNGFPGAYDTRFGSYFNTPAFVFGPKGENYHGPDEYVEIDSLITVTRVLAKFILDWCGYE
ncbi:MAG: ArgE/DapE family deacylase [candidate division Zixibacteria bacterium]|nr:ArgE/DapE family deacylase [candidate division Zixibacteria bacterium]